MVRYFTAIILLGILVFPGMASLVHWDAWAQLQYQHRSIPAMEQEGYALEDIVVPLTEITWVKAHEIVFQGEKFDLFEWKTEAGNLIAKAYRDEKETAMEASLAESTDTAGQLQYLRIHATGPYLPVTEFTLRQYPSSCFLPSIYFIGSCSTAALPLIWQPPKS